MQNDLLSGIKAVTLDVNSMKEKKGNSYDLIVMLIHIYNLRMKKRGNVNGWLLLRGSVDANMKARERRQLCKHHMHPNFSMETYISNLNSGK